MQPQYPRSVPYRPTQENAAQLGRLRRWTFLLLGAAAVLLVVMVTAGVFWANRRIADPSPEPPSETETGTTGVPSGAKGETKGRRTAKERLLEAVGGLSLVHLYQSFLNIGLLADGVENDVYTEADAEKMLKTVVDLMDLVDQRLEKLNEVGLDPEDRQSLERLRTISGHLHTQATTLMAYWSSGDLDQAARYHEARDAAWADLAKLRGGQDKGP